MAEKAGDYETNEAGFQLESEMREAVTALDFEAAARIRDRILWLKPAWKGAELVPTVAATRKKAWRRSGRP